jgi:hypothetical protein
MVAYCQLFGLSRFVDGPSWNRPEGTGLVPGAALATRRADERGDVDIRLRGAVPVLVLIVVFF